MCWALLQLVVFCTKIILMTLLYANWVLLNTVPKLLEGTCWWLCCKHWLDKVDVAPLLLPVLSGEYHSAFVYYCCNSVIKGMHRIKMTLTMIFTNSNWHIMRSEALVTILSFVSSENLFPMSNLVCSFHSFLSSCTAIHLGWWPRYLQYLPCTW